MKTNLRQILMKKPNFLMHFFAKECSLINSSKLPSHLNYLIDNRSSSVSFSQDDIAKIMQTLDLNNAYGHDDISIRMLKICGFSIYKPLEMIFEKCSEIGVFPSEWKKANIVYTHKKRRQTNTRKLPFSVTVTYLWKILKRLMFNETFNFFIEKKTYFIELVRF